MLSKIEYVYGKDKSNEVQLLGAKVFSFDGEGVQNREFYVGQSYTIDEVCSDIELASSIGVRDINVLKRRIEACDAVGVIYFPQVEKYEFLEAGDTVLPYDSQMTVQDTLEQVIAPFRENTTSKEALIDYVNQKYGYLDPEDSRSELCDLPLARQKVSAR